MKTHKADQIALRLFTNVTVPELLPSHGGFPQRAQSLTSENVELSFSTITYEMRPKRSPRPALTASVVHTFLMKTELKQHTSEVVHSSGEQEIALGGFTQ
jgi:hypothetical protein